MRTENKSSLNILFIFKIEKDTYNTSNICNHTIAHGLTSSIKNFEVVYFFQF